MWGNISRVARYAAIAAVALAFGGPVAAQDESGFQSYLSTLRQQAAAAGVSERTSAAVFPTLTLNQRVIELDRGQPGGTSGSTAIPPFAPYKARHVDDARIRRGQAAYRENRSRLARIEDRTGVPESIMVSIWGHETNYGGYTGNFDLLRSLATLAYEGRRRSLFAGEFIAGLKMLDRGVTRSQLQGSWAGATGNPQFLPSVYLRIARDGDGDGRIDIWNSSADTLASIANYFVDAGWRAGQPWGIAVTVPRGLDRSTLETRLVSPRCPRVFERHSAWRTMAEWRALGIVPQGGRWPADSVLATLLEPDGAGDTAYLLTSNYRVILDYNCSNFYALSVGLLADAVAG
ncbi:lytic murein transglycosylase [Sphingomonas oligophenolica]|uniref:Lytic murein transglycosylase n=1 Tax=Sphingomonas oligophenolica TaxID=301154 RepID=A0A502CM50_9SPHN|nr:lytic murein transglycosylase [Sphingomonas oligophenolica]TPG14267.1 lytic murein transglycosylase [Sphingomonas oligophenolica]